MRVWPGGDVRKNEGSNRGRMKQACYRVATAKCNFETLWREE